MGTVFNSPLADWPQVVDWPAPDGEADGPAPLRIDVSDESRAGWESQLGEQVGWAHAAARTWHSRHLRSIVFQLLQGVGLLAYDRVPPGAILIS